MCKNNFIVAVVVLTAPLTVFGQTKDIEEAERSVPQFKLPDPLISSDGSIVDSEEAWHTRRAEILSLFEQHVYGRAPGDVPVLRFEELSRDDEARGGTCVRRELRIQLTGGDDPAFVNLLIYTPRNAEGPVPAFLGLNFQGNHTVDSDPGIAITESWVRASNDGSSEGNRATEKGRGAAASRWPIDLIISRGFALCTAYYGDIDPDFDDGFRNGIHAALPHADPPKPDEGGSIAAWAWGLSRMLDVLEMDPLVDAAKVAVIGHSRLGKTSLWAGATDPRFAMVVSNDSGCGGAALSRRRVGETVKRINTVFPHWFCDGFNEFNDNEDALPVDQHMLVALAAPRPIYIASATGDLWADPRGEFAAGVGAHPVYMLLCGEGLSSLEMPAPDQPVSQGRIGYHLRTGKHDVTEFDWDQYLRFARRHFDAMN